MLAEGKISAADAERLLSKLAGSAQDVTTETPADETSTSAKPLKYLRVVVDSKDGDKVNVRVPMDLLRTGIKLSTMIPILAGDKLKESGIDLSHLSNLSGDELIDELRDLKVDVDSTNGDTVRVFCE
jgi:hypothetical protein